MQVEPAVEFLPNPNSVCKHFRSLYPPGSAGSSFFSCEFTEFVQTATCKTSLQDVSIIRGPGKLSVDLAENDPLWGEPQRGAIFSYISRASLCAWRMACEVSLLSAFSSASADARATSSFVDAATVNHTYAR